MISNHTVVASFATDNSPAATALRLHDYSPLPGIAEAQPWLEDITLRGLLGSINTRRWLPARKRLTNPP